MWEEEERGDMEVDNKPQPMAGFAVGVTSPAKRTDQVKRKPTHQLVKHAARAEGEKVPKLDQPPPLVRRLTPMSDLLESLLETEKEAPPPGLSRRLTPMSSLLESLLEATPRKGPEEGLVYFPAEVDVDKLVDWKEAVKNDATKTEKNNNALDKGVVINVNHTDIAVFKFGHSIIATSSKCPHAGGPLHLGDIEVLPDKSLCVRCPWHKWAFCVSTESNREGGLESGDNSKVGACVFPSNRKDKRLQIFPTISGKSRNHIKIGFDSITAATLTDEHF